MSTCARVPGRPPQGQVAKGRLAKGDRGGRHARLKVYRPGCCQFQADMLLCQLAEAYRYIRRDSRYDRDRDRRDYRGSSRDADRVSLLITLGLFRPQFLVFCTALCFWALRLEMHMLQARRTPFL